MFGVFGGGDLYAEAPEKQGGKDDNNPHGFSAEDDKKIMDWRNEFSTAPWKACADLVGKTEWQCKERFKHIKPKDWRPNNTKGNGGGGGGDAGKKGKNQGNGQEQNQNQKQGKKNKGGKKDEAPAGDSMDLWGNTNSGGNSGGNTGGAPAGWDMSFGNNTNDNNGTQNDAWDTGATTNPVQASGGDDTNTWGGGGGNTQTGDAPAWGVTNTADTGATPGGDTSWINDTSGEGWPNTDGTKNANANANANAGSWGEGGDNSNGANWDTHNGGSNNNNAGNTSNDNPWGGPATSGNDAPGGWDTTNTQDANNAPNAWDTSAPTKPASQASSKGPTKKSSSRSHRHHQHHSNHQSHTTNSNNQVNPAAPPMLELMPDDTFAADDLRLIARILQQDCSMVWNRVSWRFRDKTGRTLHPDVFERKITGRLEGKDDESEKETRRKRKQKCTG